MGGTGKLVQELKNLMLRHGIKIKYQHDVESLQTRNNAISEIAFTNGHSQKFDLFVSNADPIQVSNELIGRKKYLCIMLSLINLLNTQWAFLFYFLAQKQYKNVAHHTIWMGPRYKGLLEDIFNHHKLADDFSIYLHRPTCTDPSFAPKGHDSYYALVPVPNLKGKTRLG